MDLKVNMGTIATSVIGAALIGGITGFYSVSQKTVVNSKDVQSVKEDVNEIKEEQKEQKQLLIELLRRTPPRRSF
jgi:uncharacterized membrane protein (DUF106 family)